MSYILLGLNVLCVCLHGSYGRYVCQLFGIKLNTLERFKAPNVWDRCATGVWVDDPVEARKNINVSCGISFRDMIRLVAGSGGGGR